MYRGQGLSGSASLAAVSARRRRVHRLSGQPVLHDDPDPQVGLLFGIRCGRDAGPIKSEPREIAARTKCWPMDFDEVAAIGSLLSQLPDREAYRNAAREQLMRLVPADDALWIQAANSYGSGC